MELFDFPVSYGASQKTQHRVKVSRFGDGYTQRTGDGLNTKTTSWDLSCTGPLSFIQEVQAFIDAHGGHKAFAWASPSQPMALFVCEDYRVRSKGAGTFTVSFTFEQTFHP